VTLVELARDLSGEYVGHVGARWRFTFQTEEHALAFAEAVPRQPFKHTYHVEPWTDDPLSVAVKREV
jgi:hypothetical protein